MKQYFIGIIIGAVAVLILSIFKIDLLKTFAGSGAPSGSHYNLNLIGVPKGKTASLTGNQGHRIFVPLTGSCQIKLALGDFQVLDGNCTDGSSQFQLPDPDSDNDGVTTYSVYVRSLGKPAKDGQPAEANLKTCADYITDTTTGTTETYCSAHTTVQIRNKGKSSFENVSKQLLYVYADINLDGILERYPLFSTALQDYYWQYDNNGLKLLQMRFYPLGTDVN